VPPQPICLQVSFPLPLLRYHSLETAFPVSLQPLLPQEYTMTGLQREIEQLQPGAGAKALSFYSQLWP